MKSKSCEQCGKRGRKLGYRYCEKCLWHLMPTIKAWSKRESHYEPPAIHEDRGRSRIEPPLDGRSDDPRLLAWMAGEYDYISEDS